jgi:flagellar M-ring protein FliF
VLVKYAALLVGILVVVAFGVRPALKRAKEDLRPRQLPVTTETASLNAPEASAAEPNRKRTQEIFEEVTAHLKREPAQSSRLLQSWIHSDQQ